MKQNNLSDLYERHHSQTREEKFSILKNERGELLSKYIGASKQVLDLGCRDGALTQSFARSNTVLGTDIDPRSLAAARQTLGIETMLLDLNGDWASLGDRKFDAVVAGEILEHLYYPESIVEKVAAHLAPGGIFIGSVPNAFSLKNRLRYFLGRKKHTPLEDPTHINHFSVAELRSMLAKHFKNVEIIGLGRYSRLARWMPNLSAFNLFFIARD